MTRNPALFLLRVASGGVFVAFGAGKFVNHASELASSRTYGVPAPQAFVVVIGAIELVGGLLLIAGVFTRPAALVLAGDMVGAIILSGIAKGELISLTLAPAELGLMLVLLWSGPGSWSPRARLRPRRVDPPGAHFPPELGGGALVRGARWPVLARCSRGRGR
jgi:putative oxidoreductase